MDNFRHKNVYQNKDQPCRSTSKDSTCQFINLSPLVDRAYHELDKKKLKKLGQYKEIDVDLYYPEDKDMRRKFVKELRLSVPIMIYRMSYGGNLGTLNYVWSVPIDDSPERATFNAIIISKISDKLPKYSTRAMRRDFINMYTHYVKAPVSSTLYVS